ncbi:flavin reductase domain protein FMN-binding [Hymenobacter roseosalivarius DSM 11622]|uniref:Flavin reductase domain protein FMN-binding n=1 Tax=Hymenobacter roseosalivarius DSM 11622 TaxID=645990 RepID=A0A1W1W0S4_9BACT|nr:flavin reductase [Hymenobacter roseosalivarius]SMB99229.1 flavin reductase domain protein FMN-binding [Hymenobacter roseosalivarius DSM 11622]
MKRIQAPDIEAMEKIFRLNLINSITGYKPANLIGSADAAGRTNLAIYSSVVHLGSNPPYVGIFTRPTSVARHTYDNISASGCYTINHVHESFTAAAHYTSAPFPEDESEFEACGLGAEFLDGFPAPYVRESRIKIGLRLVEEIPVKATGTTLLVGKIEAIYLPADVLAADGSLNLNAGGGVCISGLDTYHTAQQIGAYAYARVGEGPQSK